MFIMYLYFLHIYQDVIFTRSSEKVKLKSESTSITSVQNSPLYGSYEGLNLTNETSRKLVVFGRKLEGNNPHFIIILTNNRENNTVMLKLCIFIMT